MKSGVFVGKRFFIYVLSTLLLVGGIMVLVHNNSRYFLSQPLSGYACPDSSGYAHLKTSVANSLCQRLKDKYATDTTSASWLQTVKTIFSNRAETKKSAQLLVSTDMFQYMADGIQKGIDLKNQISSDEVNDTYNEIDQMGSESTGTGTSGSGTNGSVASDTGSTGVDDCGMLVCGTGKEYVVQNGHCICQDYATTPISIPGCGLTLSLVNTGSLWGGLQYPLSRDRKNMVVDDGDGDHPFLYNFSTKSQTVLPITTFIKKNTDISGGPINGFSADSQYLYRIRDIFGQGEGPTRSHFTDVIKTDNTQTVLYPPVITNSNYFVLEGENEHLGELTLQRVNLAAPSDIKHLNITIHIGTPRILTISPDGSTVAYVNTAKDVKGNWYPALFLHIYNVDTGKDSVIDALPSGWATENFATPQLRISNDNAYVIYLRDGDVTFTGLSTKVNKGFLVRQNIKTLDRKIEVVYDLGKFMNMNGVSHSLTNRIWLGEDGYTLLEQHGEDKSTLINNAWIKTYAPIYSSCQL